MGVYLYSYSIRLVYLQKALLGCFPASLVMDYESYKEIF